MDFVSVDDRFTLDSHDYLLKTTDDAHNNRISLMFFRHGEVIYSSRQYYDAGLPKVKRRHLVFDYHQRHKDELAKLFLLHRHRLENSCNGDASYLVACGFLKYGMLSEAIINLEHLVESDKATPLVHAALGNAYLRSSQHARALEHLRKALDIKRSYADFHFYCGICEYHLRHLEAAVESFLQAIDTNPHYGEAYFYLGLSLLLNAKLGQKYELAVNLVPRAKETFNKAVAILPALRSEAFDRGMCLLEQQDYDGALETLAPLVAPITSDKPEVINYDFHLAVLQDAEHVRPEQAWQEIKRLSELTERYPNYPDLYHELGFAYSVLGVSVKSKAMSHFEKAIEINPAYEDAQKSLKLIQNDQRGFRTMLHAMLRLQR
jgi:tetratricopeptide (TPR) repeat protein